MVSDDCALLDHHRRFVSHRGGGFSLAEQYFRGFRYCHSGRGGLVPELSIATAQKDRRR